MKAVHYGARSSGPMKAKPKKIPKKEPAQPRREAHPCDSCTFSTIQAQKTKKIPRKNQKNTKKKTWTLKERTRAQKTSECERAEQLVSQVRLLRQELTGEIPAETAPVAPTRSETPEAKIPVAPVPASQAVAGRDGLHSGPKDQGLRVGRSRASVLTHFTSHCVVEPGLLVVFVFDLRRRKLSLPCCTTGVGAGSFSPTP